MHHPLFLFIGSFISTALHVCTIYGINHISTKNRPIVNSDLILEHEPSDHHVLGLNLALPRLEDLLKMGSSEDAKDFSQTVNRLEHHLLHFDFSKLLFDDTYQPQATLLQLLDILGMEPPSDLQKPLLQINTWAQKHLLRRGERWEEQTNHFEPLKPKIIPLLAKLGFINARYPHFKHYQGAIIHGCSLVKARDRLAYLIEKWNQGVRFSHIYFLTGERLLDPKQENNKTFLDDSDSLLKIKKNAIVPSTFPKTENGMIQLLWEQSDIPETLRQKVMVHFINAPMKKNAQGEKTIRPTTDDTVVCWLSTSPPHGTYLAVSNAPYINRQDLIVKTIASDDYCFETIGAALNEDEKIAIILDELARYIYQLTCLFKNKL